MFPRSGCRVQPLSWSPYPGAEMRQVDVISPHLIGRWLISTIGRRFPGGDVPLTVKALACKQKSFQPAVPRDRRVDNKNSNIIYLGESGMNIAKNR